MVSAGTIVLFFVYLWGLGYSLTYGPKNSDNWLERNLLRVGFGLGGFIVLGVLLNMLHISIDWKIFLVISLLGPTIGLAKSLQRKKLKFPQPKITKLTITIFAVLVIFAITLGIYTKGAFSYPYLENDDPWGHALSSKFVSQEKTFNNPPWYDSSVMGYLDPYPPGYNLILGVLHQTSPELQWTLKFFNALLISLGIIFFFFMVLHLVGDRNKALLATAIFAMIPSYLSHFIWAHVLPPTLFFVVMYAVLKIPEDRKWWVAGSFAMAGVFLSHPLHHVKIVILVLLFVFFRSIALRKIQWWQGASVLGGLALAMLWWLPGKRWVSMFLQTGHARNSDVLRTTLESGNFFEKISTIIAKIPSFFGPMQGSGTRTYFFKDFFFAQKQNMINNPIGTGIVVYLLVFLGVAGLLFYLHKHFRQKLFHSPKHQVQKGLVKFFGIASFTLTLCLALRYVTLLFLGPDTFPILLSLWLDLLFFGSAAVLGVLALIVTKSTKIVWKATALAWLATFFLLVTPSSFNFPIGIDGPFRTWMLFAVPTAVVAAEGFYFLKQFSRKKKGLTAFLLLAVLLGVFYTSGIQKYSVNTASWPPGQVWTSMTEIQGYTNLLTLPARTKVYPFSGRHNVIGFNADSCLWCKEETEFRNRILDRTAKEIHTFLKSRGYEYLILDGMSFTKLVRYSKHTKNETDELLPGKIEEILRSGLFEPAHQTNGFILLKVL